MVHPEDLKRLADILGLNLLAGLLNISRETLDEYCKNISIIPEVIEQRLSFLAKLCLILAGAYNKGGARQWFGRRRAQLGNKPPLEMLRNNWNPQDVEPQKILDLAQSINI